MPKNADNADRARQLLAQEAARLIVDQGLHDYRAAKVKAAGRLGLRDRGSLPSNAEIEAAVSEFHKIFGGEAHTTLLSAMRTAALSAMDLLADYEPRLVGAVLNGTADNNSAVNLHVFADSAEVIAFALTERGLRYRPYERRLKSRQGRTDSYAGFGFVHLEMRIEATVFPFDGLRQAPISPIDGRPMRRADRRVVSELAERG